VNVIAPGANDTETFQRAAAVEPGMLKDLPTKPGGPSRLALFLASDGSNHISGKFIHVDQDWATWTAADVAGHRYTLRRQDA
jgi:NAD(P)-dependent dehydrogenase (short-subunit alcohol dehydrogenase family)